MWLLGLTVTEWLNYLRYKCSLACTPTSVLTFPCLLCVQAPGLNELGLDLLSQMLAFDASERISAKRAMQHPYFDDLDPALRDSS